MKRKAKPAPGIHGVGVDILHLTRIEKVWKRHGERLVEKILCKQEREAFAAHRQKVPFLTKSFAAKEAFVKALGTGFAGVGYQDAGVVRAASGQPCLVFSPKMRARLKRLGITRTHLSLSDEGGLVCAFVVLERI